MTSITASNFLKSTLLKRSKVIFRYSYGQFSRNTSTKSTFTDYRKKIVYNTKVIQEIAKEVYKKEELGPPSKSQISEAWENLKSIKLQNLYDLNTNDYLRIGIRSIEVAGFFALGEIIGRFSIIGYNV